MRTTAAPFSCDTLVSFTGLGADRRVIFGKNSDRPWDESQPLTYIPAEEHAAGTTVRCQYVTIPQAERTLAVLGSRPWWLWGFEHGLNSAGVAIGNEAIYTRDDCPSVGLLGMDLVRLGLERGATAAAAKAAMTNLLERHGQGGAAMYLMPHRYHSSFIIADAREAFVLETSGPRWVSKRVKSSVAIANLATISDDWDEASHDVEEHAREQGWWNERPSVKFDFRRAYEDESMRVKTEARYQRSCRFLNQDVITASSMMTHLRDHFDGGSVYVPDTSADHGRPRSICLHPESWANGGTTASMVADLTAAAEAPVAWCSMATPCTGAFIPVPVGVPLPSAWSIGSDVRCEGSLWWAMHDLAEAVQVDPGPLTLAAQEVWGPWEAGLLRQAYTDRGNAADEIAQRTARLLENQAALLRSFRRKGALSGDTR